jgi:hypothetical protein
MTPKRIIVAAAVAALVGFPIVLAMAAPAPRSAAVAGKVATVRLNWELPARLDNLKWMRVAWTINGQAPNLPGPLDLDATVDFHTIDVPANADVVFSVKSIHLDRVRESAPSTITFNVGNLTADDDPRPPGPIRWSIDNIRDVP